VKGFVFGTAWDVMTLIAEGMKESEHSSRRPSKASLDVGALPICGDEISQSAYSPTWILWSSTLAMTATLSAPPLGRWRTRHIAAEISIEDSLNLFAYQVGSFGRCRTPLVGITSASAESFPAELRKIRC
jgi:hypothetical protein